MKVQRVAGSLGAEVSGIDLSAPLRAEALEAIRGALLEHLVLFFRNQPLTPESFLAFARSVGTPVEYPFVQGLQAYPEIIEVKKLERERMNFGGIWHTDTAYLECPPMGSMPLAREVPPFGGDTEFADQYDAYDALSDGMKRLLEGLRAVNSSAKADVTRTREDRVRDDGRVGAGIEHVAEHPVIRTHPETGRKALYVNVAHTMRFAGMSAQESEPLLRYLFAHQVRPEFTCRFRWEVGALAWRDNRCTLHNPINDYHGYRRVMHRITLAGDTPR